MVGKPKSPLAAATDAAACARTSHRVDTPRPSPSYADYHKSLSQANRLMEILPSDSDAAGSASSSVRTSSLSSVENDASIGEKKLAATDKKKGSQKDRNQSRSIEKRVDF